MQASSMPPQDGPPAASVVSAWVHGLPETQHSLRRLALSSRWSVRPSQKAEHLAWFEVFLDGMAGALAWHIAGHTWQACCYSRKG